ncbi:hypothetical protein K2173_007157 [Erythroxylum novogranatense]|uniref:ADP-ribosyl cyclase/cyclic ADP-ribose hydrolase n=1 Tax=Erythroxylum novogranatense TaxID=1862640 RepID=A0AAV8SYZ7_9ROSI|nr:hypothetical protein K2173_007157 [Erythroxylum novogranatense]
MASVLSLLTHKASSSKPQLSSSKPKPCWKYDVFLSFRGEDTRNNFLSHLYKELNVKGIHTFKDDLKLGRGALISKALETAVEESMFSIVVISEDYASSSWCLDELVKIMECREKMGQIVIPVFYNVDPSDVRKKRGNFAVMEKNFKEAEPQRVESWRNALGEVASISGWDTRNRNEATLIEHIVRDVSDKLVYISLSDADDLVGISSHVQQMEALLDLRWEAVQMVGIWGIGGLGKTTIAKVIYDKLSNHFEAHCFLADVKEKFKKNSASALQKELLSKVLQERDLSLWSLDEGSNVIKKRLCHRKVLLVLDDVDDLYQLEILVKKTDWFGAGSRIIITTRDKHLLEAHGVDAIYQPKGLGNEAALHLFSRYAFKQNLPNNNFLDLSYEFLSYAEGLPLALKVLGAFLYGRSIDQWHSELDKLKRLPNLNIQNILRISYDSLESIEKEVFLDIACFFTGDDKDVVRDILDGCGFFSDRTFGVLIDKALIMISRNKLCMHGLLREMGCEIVRQESKIIGERTRLWDSKDVHHVLTKKAGTEKVEGLFLELSDIREIHLDSDAFTRMNNLRMLKVHNLQISGQIPTVQLPGEGLYYLSDELRYLHWHSYPLKFLPLNFCAENLVELHLPYGNVEQLWGQKQHLANLQLVDLNHSKLTKIPDLSGASKLRSLNLEDCKNLVDLSTIEFLTELEYLNLSGCTKLKGLPQLPRNTKYVYLAKTAIEVLPPFEGPSDLVELDLRNCKRLEHLPSSICELKSLQTLNVCGCSNLLKRLSSVDNDSTWSYFNILWGVMSLLIEATLNGITVPKPSDIFFRVNQPSDIRYLSFAGTAIEELPSSISNHIRLEELDLSNCTRLKILPSCIYRMGKLVTLNIAGCLILLELATETRFG